MEGTVRPGHRRTSPISVLIVFLNRSRKANVVCKNIYLKILIIERDANRKSSRSSIEGILPLGHAEPDSDADDVPLLHTI